MLSTLAVQREPLSKSRQTLGLPKWLGAGSQQQSSFLWGGGREWGTGTSLPRPLPIWSHSVPPLCIEPSEQSRCPKQGQVKVVTCLFGKGRTPGLRGVSSVLKVTQQT